MLVEHFVAKHAQRAGKRIDGLERRRDRRRCRRSDWPGNVRELENTIERAVVLSPGTMIGADVVRMLGGGGPAAAGLPSLDLRQNIDWAERETVRRALDSAGGVKKDAAEIDGHQPARPELLPRQTPRRVTPAALTTVVTAYGAGNPRCAP